MIQKILLLFVVLTVISCKPKQELILLETELGNMKISLYDSTPKHRDNFKKLVSEGYYDGLLFHRIIKGFMVQGGDPDSRNAPAQQRLGTGGPPYKVDAEIGAYHYKGTLAAARTPDGMNPERQSSGSQFYIVQGRPIDEARLNSISKQKKISYSPEQIARYVKNGGTPGLDNDYTVFGEVVDGMEVIDKIASVQTAPGDRPVKDLKMKLKIIKE